MKTGRDAGLPLVRRLSDFPATDAVYVGTVRSRSSHGLISSISLPHLPRGYLSITADDIPGSKMLQVGDIKVPILASGRVAYRGEPVALIVGPDKNRIAEAIELARVRVEKEDPDYSFESFDSGRLAASRMYSRGDIETAFSEADKIVEGEYRVGPQDHYYPEPQGSVAAFDYDKLVVFSSTQWPFQVRNAIAEALRVKREEVIVRSTLLGPHLDGKLWYPSLISCHAALAAVLCAKPAILQLSRSEDFLYSTKRAPTLASYRAALDAGGRLTAIDSSIVLNTGAYAPFAEEMTSRSAISSTGAYACPNVRVVSRAVRTNLPPMGAFTGLGTTPIAFAMERLAEDCAAVFDMDPSDWRALNCAVKGDSTFGGTWKKSVPYQRIVDRLLVMSDYPRKRSSFELIRKRSADPSASPGYGIGLAFGRQLPAGGFGRIGSEALAVEITMSKDSRLVIKTSTVPVSVGAVEAWRRSAATILGLRPAAVTVEALETDKVPDSGPATLSRTLSIVTKLVTSACEGLRTKRFREALPITVRKSQRAGGKAGTLESALESTAWAGTVVEVSLAAVDNTPSIRGVWIVARAGRLLSPSEAVRTLERDAAISIGMCLGEHLELSDGPASLDDLSRYKLPRLKDAPPIHVEFLEDDTDPQGIGELAYSLVPPAFANALSQALDARQDALPWGSRTKVHGDSE